MFIIINVVLEWTSALVKATVVSLGAVWAQTMKTTTLNCFISKQYSCLVIIKTDC